MFTMRTHLCRSNSTSFNYRQAPEGGVSDYFHAFERRPPLDVAALVREELFLALSVDVDEDLEGVVLLADSVKDLHLEMINA